MARLMVWMTREQAEYLRDEVVSMAENEARFNEIEKCVDIVHALDEALEDAEKRKNTEV